MSNLLEQASLVMIPSGYKEDVVYSEIPINGAGDMSFTRASNGTRINSQGLVEVCPWNLLQQSNSFSTSPWFLVGTPTLTSNYAANPLTGANDAWRFQSASDSERVVQSLSGSSNAFSLYAKGTGTIRLRDSAGTYSTDVALTSSWQRVLVDIPAAFTNVQITSNGGCDATIYGAQVNIGSTAKPYFPTTDRLNVPRLTYQNGGGGCPSLLLEKQSTNLQTYSEDFTQWTASSATVTANNTTSPDGTQNADRVQFTGAGYLLGTSQGSGNVYTLSCWAKRNGSGTQSVGFFKDGSGVVDSAWALTSDWQRFTYTYTASNGSYSGIAGVNGVDVFVWGAQFEQSSYPTSYIPTTSSSATRVADACSKTGISSLIGQTEGTLFVDFVFTAYDSQAKWIAFLGGGSYYIGLYTDGSSHFVAEVYDNAFSFLNQTFTFSVGTRYKLALAYKTNDFAFYVNGTQVATDNSGTVPATSQFSFEYNSTANNNTSRTYNQAILFPTRLTNAELASLTTI